MVSYPELMKQATNLTSYTHLLVQTYLIVALSYVVVNLLLSHFARWLERRLARRVRTGAARIDAPGPDTATPDTAAPAPRTMV